MKSLAKIVATASLLSLYLAIVLYRNNRKNREFDKEVPQNFHLERVTILRPQGTSEDENFEKEPTPSKTDSSCCFDITKDEAAVAQKATSLENVNDAEKIRKNKIKIRASGFYPQGSLTREIYGNWFPEGSLEYDYLFCRHLSFFINGAYTRKNGHSIGEAHKTTITLVPMTIGINAQFGNSSWWHPYLGAGIGPAYCYLHNFSAHLKQHRSYLGFASIFQMGMEFDITKCFLFDLFTSYRFNWFEFNKKSSKRFTGGVDLGVGIGVRF